MDLEPIWKRAKSDLLIPSARGEADVFLWEHSVRVARSAEQLLDLPAVRQAGPDSAAVIAAALYHEAAWALRGRAGEWQRLDVLHSPLSDEDREECARLLELSLRELVSAVTLERAVHAVRTYRQRNTDSVEARVVADAVNLQEFGVLSLWSTVRRAMLDGRGVQSILDAWQRKKEYHFWAARLADAFHFESVRELAQRRLERLERVMEALGEEHAGLDVAGSVSAGVPVGAAVGPRP